MTILRRTYAPFSAAFVRAVCRRVIRYLGNGDLPIGFLAGVILLAGLALRIWHFAGERSLWLDEAMVATSIVGRDWTGLMQPLAYLQLAPIGWLFVEKASLETFGGLEHALRLPQFLGGVASLAAFVIVARRYLGQAGFIVAIAVFAICSQLIYYSAEVKPYGVDVFFSVVFLCFGARYFADNAALKGLDIAALAIVGAAAAACSFPSIIIMASFGCLLFLREILHRRFVNGAAVAAAGLLWLAVFLWFLLNVSGTNGLAVDDMTDQWNGGFAPLLPKTTADIMWFVDTAFGFFEYVFGKMSTIVAISAAVIGVCVSPRKGGWFAAAVLLPFLVALIVSGLHLYPISNRVTLYLLPQLIVLVAAGVEASISAMGRKIAATSLALGLVLAGTITVLWQNFTYFPSPYATENIRSVLEKVALTKSSAQPIYVDHYSLPAFRIYQSRAGLQDAAVIEGARKRGDIGCLLAEIQTLRKHDQVWVLSSHADKIWDQPEDTLLRYFAKIGGRELIAIDLVSVHAILIDFEESEAGLFAPLLQAMPPKRPCG